jgi:hypothetical protein
MYGSGYGALNRSARRKRERAEGDALVKAVPYRPCMQYAMHYKYMLHKRVSKTTKASGIVTSEGWTLQDWLQNLKTVHRFDSR